jgi:hypothetical protein
LAAPVNSRVTLRSGQRAAHFLQSKVNDLEQLLFAERIKDNDFVNAVEEFRLEVNSQGIHYLLARLLRIPGGARRFRGQRQQVDVGSHDEDGVAEVDRAAFAVREAAVVHDLQKDVEDIAVSFLDLVKKHDRVGRRRTASVSWPPSS